MKRTFLITGATKGIGLALSHRLASEGHAVVGIARNASEGFPGAFHPLDLADPASGDKLAAITREAEVDGIVNNVGLVRAAPLGDIPVETLEEVMRVNLHPALVAT